MHGFSVRAVFLACRPLPSVQRDKELWLLPLLQFSSVAQSWPTLCDPHDDSELVKDIANEMVKVFTDTVKRVIGAENVNVIDYAYVVRTGPMRARNTVLIALAGAILVVGLIVLKEFADTTFRTAEEVEEILDLPVLAQVNRIKSTQSKGKKKSK